MSAFDVTDLIGEAMGQFTSPADALEFAEAAGPGPAAVIAAAAAFDMECDDSESVRLFALFERCVGWLAGWQAQYAAHAIATAEDHDERQLVLEMSLATARTIPSVRAAIGVGSLAINDAEFCEALDRGNMSADKAAITARAVERVVDPAELGPASDEERTWRGKTVEHAAFLAPNRTPPQLRRELDKFTARINPEHANQAAARAFRERRVDVVHLPDAMGELRVRGPIEDVNRAHAALTEMALAEKDAKDAPVKRTTDQRRYDAFARLAAPARSFEEAKSVADRLSGAAIRPHLVVVVRAETLLGLDDSPAEVLSGGWIPAEAARRIATCATWQKLLADPVTGRVVGLGDTVFRAGTVFEDGAPEAARPWPWREVPSEALACNSYGPSRGQIRTLVARDQGCVVPTCAQPAWRCQHDHVEEFDPDKPAIAQTYTGNLELLCKAHHDLKTEKHWDFTRDPDTGVTTLTTDLGTARTIPAATVGLAKV